MKAVKILVGIDPSFSNFGIAEYEITAKKYLRLETKRLLVGIKTLGEIVKAHGKEAVGFVIENPALDSNIFGQWGIMLKSIRSQSQRGRGGETAMQQQFGMSLKIASSVGANKAAAELAIEILESWGCPVVQIAPSARHRADRDGSKANVPAKLIELLAMPTKTNAEQFERLTGYAARSNEHNRDAATLVWGRSSKWFEVAAKKDENKLGF